MVFDHLHFAASSFERREPRLDRGGLRLGERVVVEVQRLQRCQRNNLLRKRRQLVPIQTQRLLSRHLSNLLR